MENLFFPARRAYSPRPILRPTPPSPAPKSRVISIPVHFADDKQRLPESAETDDKHRLPEPDRSSAAVTIQKILRGFLVRKNMQIVKKIAAEVAEIGHQISAIKIREDAKERLRIGEMLMALLLRLDAVRGVREYRKKVIRRVIQLQEAVDSIAQGDALNSDESKSMPTGDVNDLAMDDCLTVPEEFGEEETQKEDLMIDEASENGGEGIEEESCGVKESIENSEYGGEEIEGESWGVKESIENSMGEAPGMVEMTPASGAEVVVGMKEAMERASAETEALRMMVGELCERSAQAVRTDEQAGPACGAAGGEDAEDGAEEEAGRIYVLRSNFFKTSRPGSVFEGTQDEEMPVSSQISVFLAESEVTVQLKSGTWPDDLVRWLYDSSAEVSSSSMNNAVKSREHKIRKIVKKYLQFLVRQFLDHIFSYLAPVLLS